MHLLKPTENRSEGNFSLLVSAWTPSVALSGFTVAADERRPSQYPWAEHSGGLWVEDGC